MSLPDAQGGYRHGHSLYFIQDTILAIAYAIIDVPSCVLTFFKTSTDNLGVDLRELALATLRPFAFLYASGLYTGDIARTIWATLTTSPFRENP